jgi:hypothetical protein
VRAKTIVASCAAGLAIAATLFPASALGAGTHRFRTHPSVSIQLNARGSHGFRYTLFTGSTGAGILSVSKTVPRDADTTVDYFLLRKPRHDHFDPDRLDVRIGRLGHFRGHFVANSTETMRIGPFCKGKPGTVEKGFFVGSFRFRGERGYTTLRSRRERGQVTHQASERCALPSPESESTSPAKESKERAQAGIRLLAATEDDGVIFQADHVAPVRRLGIELTHFDVTVVSHGSGGVAIIHSATVFELEADSSATFETPNLAEPLAETRVAPPAPFSGSANFHLENRHAASWTGDLGVELPGLGSVPLTGDGITAGACQGPSNCTKTLPKPLQKTLETSPDIVTVFVGKRGTKRPAGNG